MNIPVALNSAPQSRDIAFEDRQVAEKTLRRGAETTRYHLLRTGRRLARRIAGDPESTGASDVQEFTLTVRAPRRSGEEVVSEVVTVRAQWSLDGIAHAVRSRYADDRTDFRTFSDEVIVPRAVEIARETFSGDCMLVVMIAVDMLIHRTYEELRRDGGAMPAREIRSLVRLMTARIERTVKDRLGAVRGGRDPEYVPTNEECRTIAENVDAVWPLLTRAAPLLREGEVDAWRAQLKAEIHRVPTRLRQPLLTFISATLPRATRDREAKQMALRFARELTTMRASLRKFEDFYNSGRRELEVMKLRS